MGDESGFPVALRTRPARRSISGTVADREVELRAALLAPVRASEAEAARTALNAPAEWPNPAAAAEVPVAAPVTPVPPPPVSLPASQPQAGTRSGGDVPIGTATVPQPAPDGYTIQAGTLIPATLLTGIDSDLPGEVLAQVSREVYDSRTLRTLLVPRGSRLIGRYEDRTSAGQSRLLVSWTRLVFPDGRSVRLPSLETKDQEGAGGMSGDVDHHTRRTVGTAALLSVIGAATQLSQPHGGGGPFGAYPTPQQVGAAAVGQELAQVATQLLRRDLDIRPTIRVRRGMPFNVFLGGDVTFAAPYAEAHP